MKDYFDNGFSLEELNRTNLVLILKIDVPVEVGNFRPISLCKFSYKVVSKVITNILKDIMPRIISENQRAFVSGRLIQDNILVVHEAFHYLKDKKRGNLAEMAIKMDMNKAYDRVEWDFLAQVLLKLGFKDTWVERVMNCIDSASFNLLLSGKKVSNIRPKRGLRHEDPMLSKAVSEGQLTGIKLARSCPMLTHCLFANNSIFILKVESGNCRNFAYIMQRYCLAS